MDTLLGHVVLGVPIVEIVVILDELDGFRHRLQLREPVDIVEGGDERSKNSRQQSAQHTQPYADPTALFGGHSLKIGSIEKLGIVHE